MAQFDSSVIDAVERLEAETATLWSVRASGDATRLERKCKALIEHAQFVLFALSH